MKRAHEIRRNAATKFNCKVSEIIFSECLKMAWSETKGEGKMDWTTNGSGYVNFNNKDWGFAGDKKTWAKLENGKATVKRASKGIISSAFDSEMESFCSDYGIDWASVGCGQTVTS